MRKIILVCMMGPYTEPKDGAELWGCNRTYETQCAPLKTLDRLYFFDDTDLLEKQSTSEGVTLGFVRPVADLGVPVFCRQRDKRIPMSRAFPIVEVIRFFRRRYFTSTLSYMMAHAIYEGCDHIHLHRLISNPVHYEYGEQKPCMDYWYGQAEARGIEVTESPDCSLGKPFPWQAAQYGYFPGNPHLKALVCSGTVGVNMVVDHSVPDLSRFGIEEPSGVVEAVV